MQLNGSEASLPLFFRTGGSTKLVTSNVVAS